ncbi:MAG: DUF4230 domain-containing protein [Polyangiaceae bacterium]
MTALRATPRSKTAALVALAVALGVGLGALVFRPRERPFLPASSIEVVEVTPRPNVIGAVRELHELVTAEQTVERVLDIRDKQSRVFGLVNSEDALLLVASGYVAAGIDLGELQESDVSVDWEKRSVRMKLPPARVLSSRLDNERTYVHSRKTDVLAARAESLEGQARLRAQQEIVQAAKDAGLVQRAGKSAVRTLEAMLRGLGFARVEVIASES